MVYIIKKRIYKQNYAGNTKFPKKSDNIVPRAERVLTQSQGQVGSTSTYRLK
jgi:hypothetical protein